MGKKQNSKSKFSESIDNRFMGIFKTVDSNITVKPCATTSNERSTHKQSSDGDKGFKDFLAQKLFEFLESNTKEVERSIPDNELVQFKIEDVRLFSDSDIISQDLVASSSEIIPPKKKRKKEKNNEDQLKEVAVTADWIHKQAQLFNS